MSDINVDSVLAQIRALSAQASSRPQAPKLQQVGGADNKAGFGTLLQSSIDKVNDAQTAAAQQQRAFEMGDPNTDLSTVMISTAKAQVSFNAMVQVRNKLVAAYQDIMNMPL